MNETPEPTPTASAPKASTPAADSAPAAPPSAASSPASSSDAPSISRRDLLLGALATAGTGVACSRIELGHSQSPESHASPGESPHESPSESINVAIVGAGASGLMAATLLRDAGKSVVVIEANPRVGGRLKGGILAGETIDLGGQWFGPGQSRVMALATRFGMTKFDTHIEGRNLMEYGGRVLAEQDLPPDFMMGFLGMVGRINRQAKQLADEGELRSPNAAALDSISMEAWARENVPDEGLRDLLRVAIETVFCVPPRQLSAFSFFSVLEHESFMEMIGTSGGAQESLYAEGLHRIPEKLAESLGDRVILGAPVRAIRQDEYGVEVVTDGRRWKAARVIVTVPIAVAARIEFSPPLPHRRVALMQRSPMGSVIKCLVAYPAPFWREQGLSGQAALSSAAYAAFFDTTRPGAPCGVLSGFMSGQAALDWADRPEGERKQQVLADIARALGPKALEPLDFIENNWPREAWSLGGYSCVPMPGTMTSIGDLFAEPTERIHWAGTETADEWNGYVEGALQSAERAVGEVLTAMGERAMIGEMVGTA